jgi:nickel-dependent lactate racemase
MRYGKTGLPLDLPDNLKTHIIQKKKMPLLSDPEGALTNAFSLPVGCKTLAEEVKGCQSVCILICDITRPVPNSIVLPAIIQELIQSGIPPNAITLLVATGFHRPNEGDELAELIGNDWVLKSIRAVNHFSRNEADHRYLGTTPRGTPVKLERRFLDADLRLVVGLVEPHFMAGYSGGRKVVLPGIAHEDTIKVLHSTKILQHERAANCLLEGNPLHEELLQAVRMAGKILAVNTVIDEFRNLSFVNFGLIEESHSAAVSFARPFFEIPVARKFKTVITSASGYPLDKTYYQTIKGMVGVTDILEPDADIFIVSECSEGLGSREYGESQSKLIRLGMDAFLAETGRRIYADVDEWETVMQVKAMKTGRIHLFSEGLSRAEKALTGVKVIESPMDAVKKCLAEKQDKQVAVIPEGPYAIPVYRPV